MVKLGAKDLRTSTPSETDLAVIKRREIYIICDNVLDTYNIGSIFRLADAVAAKCVYLCGQTETPPYHRISKAAVGTDKWVPWQYERTAIEAIIKLRKLLDSSDVHRTHSKNIVRAKSRTSLRVVAIEQAEGSTDYRKLDYRGPIVFVVGNETSGVSRQALKMADQIVEIPMFGVNRSLNVMVSLAIVMYRTIK